MFNSANGDTRVGHVFRSHLTFCFTGGDLKEIHSEIHSKFTVKSIKNDHRTHEIMASKIHFHHQNERIHAKNQSKSVKSP